MPNQQQEREHLAKANRDIAEGERRVAEQIILIQQMTERGQDTTQAQQLLQNYEETLEQWYIHRQLILDAIAQA
jgi:hypothetical protein